MMDQQREKTSDRFIYHEVSAPSIWIMAKSVTAVYAAVVGLHEHVPQSHLNPLLSLLVTPKIILSQNKQYIKQYNLSQE